MLAHFKAVTVENRHLVDPMCSQVLATPGVIYYEAYSKNVPLEGVPGVTIPVIVCGDHLAIGYTERRHIWVSGFSSVKVEAVPDLPIRISIVGDAYTKQGTFQEFKPSGYWGGSSYQDVTKTIEYSDEKNSLPYIFMNVRVSDIPGTTETFTGEISIRWPDPGPACRATRIPDTQSALLTATVLNLTHTWRWDLRDSFGTYETNYAFPLLRKILNGGNYEGTALDWWGLFFESALQNVHHGTPDESGLSVAKKKNRAILDRLAKEQPVINSFFLFLHDGSTWDKKRNNSLLSAFLESTVGDYNKLLEGLQDAMQYALGYVDPYFYREKSPYQKLRRYICLSLPGAKDKAEEAEAKADWTKRKGYGNQADGLGVTADKYPLLRAAIEAGSIPTGIFNNPDKSPTNREFPIWERALAQKGWAEIIYQIATDASRHSTYEKDVTPYLTFLLISLPRYLKRHTGSNWKVLPTYVQSQWQLEMEEAENGTTKRRSAFTPVADNDTKTVTVPYVAVAVSGVRTQWCYSRHYILFEDGLLDPESSSMVIKDVEEKLNGRDDYGLMYFTLTGTDTARGYPTFLIIFERIPESLVHGESHPECKACHPEMQVNRMDDYPHPKCRHCHPTKTGGTRVHFHRVHPCRKVEGNWRPACELVEACYQYMVGNVPAKDVFAQQGDMVFLQLGDHNPVEAGAKVGDSQQVNEFESHRFVPLDSEQQGITLYPSKAKEPKTRLGYIHTTVPFAIRHPEHQDIETMPAGWYEVRRCRSWEANPHAIWSLTID